MTPEQQFAPNGEACLCDALKEGPCLCHTQGASRERDRIAAAIDRRIEAGRGIEACWPEAQTLDWLKRFVVNREEGTA